MSAQLQTQTIAAPQPSFTPAPTGMVQRKCACGQHTIAGGECEECRQKRGGMIQRAAVSAAPVNAISPIVHDVLSSPGRPLDAGTRAFMEPRFGHDFSNVRVHTDARAAESARAVNALAYTVGRDVVFGRGQYMPGTMEGMRLMAHELTHVVQQGGRPTTLSTKLVLNEPNDTGEREADQLSSLIVARNSPIELSNLAKSNIMSLQRACLPASVCSVPDPGSPTEFGATETTREFSARGRRGAMTLARASAHGHGGRARQLETFLNAQWPSRLPTVHGIFIDQDMSPGTGALTEPCAEFVPPIAGAPAGSWCTFVHGSLNQEALIFNTTTSPTIGGMPREEWRRNTLATLIHETQHAVFGTSPHPALVGVACTRIDTEAALTELSSVMSEFIVISRSLPPGTSTSDPVLHSWFRSAITGSGESIKGALQDLRCICNCPDAKKYIIDTFNFVASTPSSKWTPGEIVIFNTELRDPVWGLDWPL